MPTVKIQSIQFFLCKYRILYKRVADLMINYLCIFVVAKCDWNTRCLHKALVLFYNLKNTERLLYFVNLNFLFHLL